jgi:hypothetical protein
MDSVVSETEKEMKVYIVMFGGVVCGVYDSYEKAFCSKYGDRYSAEIIEREVL